MKANKLAAFKKWLHGQGCEILQPTNDYEVLRFKCKLGVGVVYNGKKGLRVSAPWVTKAYSFYEKNQPAWPGKPDRKKPSNTPKMKRSLIERDGNECFYCGYEFDATDLTQEHLLSSVHNGPNRIENKALACKDCNSLAGNLPLIDKVRLREQMRREK